MAEVSSAFSDLLTWVDQHYAPSTAQRVAAIVDRYRLSHGIAGAAGNYASYLTEIGKREMMEGKVQRAEWFSGDPTGERDG